MSSSADIGKDLLGLEELSAAQIQLLLDTAEPFKEISLRAIKKVPTLRGRLVVSLFFENSTRTPLPGATVGAIVGALSTCGFMARISRARSAPSCSADMKASVMPASTTTVRTVALNGPVRTTNT